MNHLILREEEPQEKFPISDLGKHCQQMNREWARMLQRARTSNAKTNQFRLKQKKSIQKKAYSKSFDSENPTVSILQIAQNNEKAITTPLKPVEFAKINSSLLNKIVKLESESICQKRRLAQAVLPEGKGSFELKKIPHFPELKQQLYKQALIQSAYFPEREYPKHLQYMKWKLSNKSPSDKSNSGVNASNQLKVLNNFVSSVGEIRSTSEKVSHRNIIIDIKIKKKKQREEQNHSLSQKPNLTEMGQRRQKFIESQDDKSSIAQKIEKCITFKKRTAGKQSFD